MSEGLIRLPPWGKPFFQPHRYKVLYGGRGGAKSWFFARLSILRAVQGNVRILCARELQNSIKDSVHHLLVNQIDRMGLNDWFETGVNFIRCPSTGSEYVFKGLRHNADEIKSFEDVDICWVEEARNVSKASWTVLIPTIRKPGSEIWASFNTGEATDPVYDMLVTNPPPDTLCQKVLWSDNPWLTPELDAARRWMAENDPDAYDNVWEGNTISFSNAQVLYGKWFVDLFEPEADWDGPYFGADWGFSTDPTVLTKSWIHDDTLFIEYGQFGYGVENDNLPVLFDKVPGSRQHVIWADCARPETINHMNGRGFRVRGAPKWSGSIEDGIHRLRLFKKIVIHARCADVKDEAANYKHKVDRLTDEVLPDIVDKSNNSWDSVRYALHKLISNKNHRSYAGSK